MSLNIVQNSIGYVDPATSAVSTGWTVSEGKATHQSCNSGLIKSKSALNLIVGHQYTITYTVEGYSSGSVNLICGANNGISRTANSTYTETITCTTTSQLFFFSDGNLTISLLNFYDTADGIQAGATISFHEGSNQWGCEYSYQPELMIKFNDDFLAVNNGQLWLMNSSQIRNNFFGVQYKSQVTFYANFEPGTVKEFFNIRVQSNRPWFAPNTGDLIIPPTEERPLGMQSRLTRNRFNNYQGVYFADFLRNIIDPRYAAGTDVKALFEAENLKGRYMEITLTNDDTVEVVLFEIDVRGAPSFYTY